MKKAIKITLITLASILAIFLIIGFVGWMFMKSTFFDFEKDYSDMPELQEVTIDGYTFLDRNSNGALDIYEDNRRSIDDRVKDALSQMTLDEKIHLLKGSGLASATGTDNSEEGIPGAVGTIVPTPRLGIPTVFLSDGPAGLRIEPTRKGEDRTYYCTAFPIATLLASSWNQDLLYEVGNAMGNEAKEYGLDVILGPGANIHRHPFCGRNFEYFSEDPVVTGLMGAAIINGIESNGIGTSVKHYVANNQETDRDVNNAIVSERAMREIYLKGFEIIVDKSQPWTIMSSYNKVNGTYTSESNYLLTDVLRDDWGFGGLVMSDWFGGRDAVAMISAGNDLLEPGTKRQWNALKKGAENGDLTTETIDRAASRILKLIFSTRKLQDNTYGNNPDLEAHAAITRQSAAEGMVLLKNENALPIDRTHNIALLGTTSYDFIAGGTGSGDVNEAYTISLHKGLMNAGYNINEPGVDVYEAHKAAHPEEFKKPVGMQAMFNPYEPPEMSYTSEQLEEIVSTSDIGILTVGRNSGEGGDRVEVDDYLLSDNEQGLITAISEAYHNAGKKLIVVLNIGGVIETASWKSKPDAILLAWQGGQEGGNSAADIISGQVNPSGKLPMTFPINLNDHASHANFPLGGDRMSITSIMRSMLFQREGKPESKQVKNKDYTIYEEGIYVGYRHFDKSNLEISYPFGYGLSYSSFDYSDLYVTLANDTINLSITVENTGSTSGKEVVQVYTSKVETKIDRPIQELKAFAKTNVLQPGESQTLQLDIPFTDLQYWAEESAKWELERGNYEIRVGASSRDIRKIREVTLE